MKPPSFEPHVYEFCFSNLDTLVQVEEAKGHVVVRASRDTFSERRKACFIRELAAEGFIPDEYRWFTLTSPASFHRVRWLVDVSCFRPAQAVIAHTWRLMVRLQLSAVILWLIMMAVLFLRNAR